MLPAEGDFLVRVRGQSTAYLATHRFRLANLTFCQCRAASANFLPIVATLANASLERELELGHFEKAGRPRDLKEQLAPRHQMLKRHEVLRGLPPWAVRQR